MAVENIPCLDASYPLFSWSDWPDSAAALVSGGLTSEFEKEAWTAIVDHLAAVLTASGLSWDGRYTTLAGAKISEEYGDLYAAAFNSVRHNIDTAVPALWWGWAKDPNFRGYIGRKDFRGVDAYGDNGADDVYPEYFTELVRRLNFLISVLTGEAVTGVAGSGTGTTNCDAELLARLAFYLAAASVGYSISEANGVALPSKAFASSQIIESIYDAAMRSGIAAVLDWDDYLMRSDYKAGMKSCVSRNLGGHRYNLTSLYRGEMNIHNARPIAAKWLSGSLEVGGMVQFPSLPFGAFDGLEKTLHTAPVAAPQGLRLAGRHKSATGHGAEIISVDGCPVTAQGKAATLTAAVPAKLGIAYTGAGEKVVSLHAAALKGAVGLKAIPMNSCTVLAAALYLKSTGPVWVDPVQTGSNLYIRSVWSSWRDADGLQIDTREFYAPIRDGSNLYIRSAWNSYQDRDKANIDTADVFYRPHQSGSDLYIRSAASLGMNTSGGEE